MCTGSDRITKEQLLRRSYVMGYLERVQGPIVEHQVRYLLEGQEQSLSQGSYPDDKSCDEARADLLTEIEHRLEQANARPT